MIPVSENKSNYTPAPQGVHPAVCVDIIDLGEQQTDWGPKRMVEIRWQLGEIDPKSGRPFLVTKRYTASLGTAKKPSKLRDHLRTWRGRDFTAEELHEFDIEKVLGANCQLQVIHKPKDGGGFWSSVESVLPLVKGLEKITPKEYERVKDRKPKNDTSSHAPAMAAPSGLEEEPCPF